MVHRLVAGTLLALAGAAVMLAGCGGGGAVTGSVEGWAFAPAPAPVIAASARRAITVGRGPTPPAGYEPLPGALVMISGSSTVATTDAQGHFRIDGVRAGPQTLTVSKSGFVTAVVPVAVLAGQVVTVQDALLQPATRKWTFLVYLNADNDLEEFGILNVNQMEMVGSSPEVDIIVQMDRSPNYDVSNGNWVGARRMRITRDSDLSIINSQVLQDLGPTDMGSWRVLHDFVAWGMQTFPAEHYCLVLWNHGSGWRARTAAAISPLSRGVSFDDTSGTYIATADLPQALDVFPRLDLIVFDASLMQMVEVAYQIRHFGRVLVGSEESPPGEGYPYQTFLGSLVATPTMTPEQFGQEIVTQTIDYYNSVGASFAPSLTQSAVTLAKMDGVALAADGFARALTNGMSAYSTQIASARTQAQSYAYPDNKDFYDFAQRLQGMIPAGSLSTAAQTMTTAIQDAVIAEAHGSFRANSHGLAVYMPSSTTYISSPNRTTYQQLEFSITTYWDNWLSISPR